MALIKCPECRKRISDSATACPKCGFPIQECNFVKERKTSGYYKKLFKRIGIASLIVFALLIIISLAITFIGEYTCRLEHEKKTKERGRLFQLSYINPIDTYGLSNENSILGKPISEILEGYAENEDYTITSNEQFVSYTFEMKDVYWQDYDAALVIYTSTNDTLINMVEYQFETYQSDFGRASWVIKKNQITDYYGVDPIYTYVDAKYDIVEIDKDTFGELIRNDYMSLYHVDWKSSNGNATLYIANTNKEAKDFCSISFTE